MSLHPVATQSVPIETVRVARAAFLKGSLAMMIRDELDCVYEDKQFAELYAQRGQPGWSPWRLALVCILQFAEGLSDRQAAEAARGRIDWKYALGLELDDPGFDASILTEFRGRLLSTNQGEHLLNQLLEVLKNKGLVAARTQQRTDSTHILGAVRELNRLTMVIETLRQVLNELAVLEADWLRSVIEPDWFDRYSRRADDFHLPTARKAREALALQVGQDGWKVLKAVEALPVSNPAHQSERIAILREVWAQQYNIRPKSIRWRKSKDLPANGELLVSPEDPEVRSSKKRDEYWVGYKVHVTETCDAELPHIITHVETMPATSQDDQALTPIHTALQDKALLPSQHIVDAGYTNSFRLADSQEQFGIDLVGKVSVENNWQTRTQDAIPLSAFEIDFEHKQVTCPAGQQTVSWVITKDIRGQPIIHSTFPRQVCAGCVLRTRCTRSNFHGRSLGFRPQAQQQALQAARLRQGTEEFKAIYAKRAGVEGTLSQAIRRNDLRFARYRGMHKTHLQHIFVAAALNIIRLFDWLEEKPLAKTRKSPFARLAPAT